MLVRSLGQEDPLEEDMATHSSILGWRTPWTEQPMEGYGPWGHKEPYKTEHTQYFTHVHIFFFRFFSIIVYYKNIEYSFLCYTVGPCCLFYTHSLYLLIPNS